LAAVTASQARAHLARATYRYRAYHLDLVVVEAGPLGFLNRRRSPRRSGRTSGTLICRGVPLRLGGPQA
jgi:hypothetical protein